MGKLITVPFAALLRWFYTITGSYGASIILFALVIKLVLLPFQMKSKRSMIRMGRLSGKQAELQKQYAKNQQKYQEELQKLYQEEGVNPMGGCLWSFLPLLLMLPLYSIIYRPITYFMGLSEEAFATVKELALSLGYDTASYNAAYEQIGITDFIHQHWAQFQGKVAGLIDVDFTFLGLDLSSTPTSMVSHFIMTWACVGVILIPFIAAATQFVSSKIMMKTNGQSAEQQKQGQLMSNLILPLSSIWFCFMMPAAMGVYWIINSVLMTIQEVILGKFYTKKLQAEEDELAAKREAARKARMDEAKKRAAEQREISASKPAKKQPQKSPDKKVSTNEAGRVGDRPYARGRSYQEDRYDDNK